MKPIGEACIGSNDARYFGMSKVEQLEAELQKLAPTELLEIRNWLEEFLEDQLKFTGEFEAKINQSEREMKDGVRPRVRQP
jgi:hypothetical protein